MIEIPKRWTKTASILPCMFAVLAGCSASPTRSLPAMSVAQIAACNQEDRALENTGTRLREVPPLDGPFDQPRSPADALFPLSIASFGSTSATSPASPPHDENLFSIDYVKRVGRDMKHAFTAPVNWDTADWLTAGGVVAAVGVAYAFDKEIAKAAQRNRNATVDRIFNNIQPFGAEYSAGVLVAFYLDGEFLHDPRRNPSRSTALARASSHQA